MQTHDDRDFWERLEERARKTVLEAASKITTGTPDEPVLAAWEAYGIYVERRPDDEQGILRVSVGGGVSLELKKNIDYCVFRGDPTRCAHMLEQAALALRQGEPNRGEKKLPNLPKVR